MILNHAGIYERVRAHVEQAGREWECEVNRLHVSEAMRSALVKVKPLIFYDEKSCAEILRNQFPSGKDVSSDDMIKAIRQALTRNDRFPLTLVVLDEVQQYIGEDSQRSIDVQEAVEACCKNIGGKLLFIGTGQTAVTGTSNLKKLEGRFTIRVELSDTDVDAVIRQVILAKKPQAKAPIEQVMQTNLGEISRHLAGATIGHRQSDIAYFSQDYPILPVRRRFWESTLRILDQTGTDSQLRNQLSMVHKVIQTNVNAPLRSVVPADYLYFDSADKLLQARILPRKVHEKTMNWVNGNGDERLIARACGLVFLINKLGSSNQEIGIHATVDMLADLLVEDLGQGSTALRSKLPGLLDKCDLLIKVGNEYRIQTEESAAWNDEFLRQRSNLANEAHRIEAERDDRIRKTFAQTVRKLSLLQGEAKVSREISAVFDNQLPADANQKICVWVRDGWSTDEDSVRADARQAGNQSPTLFVFIPKRSADDLRHHLMDYKAANATLELRGAPTTPEGSEARSAMETTRQTAEDKIRELLGDVFAGARLFQGGGNEIMGNDLSAMIDEAAHKALQRVYPHFDIADHSGWYKVYERAQKGAPDALKAVNDDGEVARNPVCKAILGAIAGGKRGAEIRTHFESPPYGWSRDAVDGGLQILGVAGLIRAQDERGQAVDCKELERKTIGKTLFKVESATISAPQRIQIRKLLQKVGLTPKQGEESASVAEFLQIVKGLAESAGGEAPKPAQPDISSLDEIRRTAGNEQLLLLYNRRDELTQAIDEWRNLATRIDARWPNWQKLTQLLKHATDIPDAAVIQAQISTICQQRQLLEEPDLVQPLVTSLTQLLRQELNSQKQRYEAGYAQGIVRLQADGNWQQLEPEQRDKLLSQQHLLASDAPMIDVASADTILTTLSHITRSAMADRVAALNGRFEAVLAQAAKLLEPQAQFVQLTRRTLKNEAEIERWLAESKRQLQEALKRGPVVITLNGNAVMGI
jgi:hypothetical protein